MRYIYIPWTLQPVDCDTLRNLQSERYCQAIYTYTGSTSPFYSRLYIEQGSNRRRKVPWDKEMISVLKRVYLRLCWNLSRPILCSFSLPLSLSLSHTHTHTHTHLSCFWFSLYISHILIERSCQKRNTI